MEILVYFSLRLLLEKSIALVISNFFNNFLTIFPFLSVEFSFPFYFQSTLNVSAHFYALEYSFCQDYYYFSDTTDVSI